MVQQERARRTRDKILLGAATVIERVGYPNATLNDITEASGVTRGAFYFHFESKEEVARALVDEQNLVTRNSAQRTLAMELPALELMMRLCHDLAERLIEDPIVRAGIRLTTDSSTFEEPLLEPYSDWMATFESLAREALRRGEITEAVSPEALAGFIIPSFTGIQLVSESFTGRLDLIARVSVLWTILVHAIVTPSRVPAALRTVDAVFSAPPAPRVARE